MGQILKFKLPVDSFDPETLATLGVAYDRAVAKLNGSGQSRSLCELVAGRIMSAATQGERDLDTLCQFALHGIA